MIDFTEIPYTDDTWELFARDFLIAKGFQIESQPDRGPDGGKDIIVTERLPGQINNYTFRWLVSCKHFAQSSRAVGNSDELNILERVSAFRADGFIGFYSTLPSSALNTLLSRLKAEGKVKDFTVIDGKAIERDLVTVGYSHLMLRYLPKSYQLIRPVHNISDRYEPLLCKKCGKDLLGTAIGEEDNGIIVFVCTYSDLQPTCYDEVYCACKGSCDRELEGSLIKQGKTTAWKGISELCIPLEYIRSIMATMNELRAGSPTYTDSAYAQYKNILLVLAQKALRPTTEAEREFVKEQLSLPPL